MAKKHPNYYRIYIELGDNVSNISKSISYYQKALEHEHSAYITACIAYAFTEEDEEEAKNFAEISLNIDPECCWGYLTLAKVEINN